MNTPPPSTPPCQNEISFSTLHSLTHNVRYTPQDIYSLVAILDLKMAL